MLHTTKHGDKVFCEASYQYLWNTSVQEEMRKHFSEEAYDPAVHAIFNTESDDHEHFIIEPRKGLEDIKRHRWGREQSLHSKMTRRRPRKGELPQPARSSYDWEDEDTFRQALFDIEESTVGDEFIEPYALTEYIECQNDCTTCERECINGNIDWEASQNWILNI